MRSVRQLRDTAQRERTKAESLRKEAQGHRDRIGTFSADADPKYAATETDTAQKLEERASQHDQTALSNEQEAADLEAKALELERRTQELQARTQNEIDKLEGQKKALRGEG